MGGARREADGIELGAALSQVLLEPCPLQSRSASPGSVSVQCHSHLARSLLPPLRRSRQGDELLSG